MQNQSEHHEHRLNQELDAILRPLGVQQEGRQETSGQQNGDLHITCVYSGTDGARWNGLEPFLALIQRRQSSMAWHRHRINNVVSLAVDPYVNERIKQDILRADIV